MEFRQYSGSLFWISILLLLTICPVMGQINKSPSKEDYKRWNIIRAENISENAQWVSFSLNYESGKDTLFIKNTSNGEAFAFEGAKKGIFVNNSVFACLLPNNQFFIYNLKEYRKNYIENITDFYANSENIVLVKRADSKKISLLVCSLDGRVQSKIENVINFRISPDIEKIACSIESEFPKLLLYNLKSKTKAVEIKTSHDFNCSLIKWHESSMSLVFAGSSRIKTNIGADMLLFYKIKDNQSYEFFCEEKNNSGESITIEGKSINSLSISQDQKHIFFMKKTINHIKTEDNVQIWNSHDKDLEPQRKINQSSEKSQIMRWTPESQSLVSIGDSEQPYAMLNGNQHFALLYNTDDNKPTFKRAADLNYMLLNIETGQKSNFLECQPNHSLNKTLSFSPCGKFILFFKDKNWQMYSTEQNVTVNLTKNISDFSNKTAQYNFNSFPHGFAGWTANDRSVVVYDEFDLWEFDTADYSFKKLTSGRNQDIIYRLASYKVESYPSLDAKAHVLIPGENFILIQRKKDNSKSGFASIDKNGELQVIAFESKLLTNIKKSTKGNHFMYTREDFNLPPQLIIKKSNAKPKLLFQSCPDYKKFSHGHSELITYQNSKSDKLNGVLFYPAGYNPHKLYPMIVSIYEKQTSKLHQYVNPSLLNGSSFNITNFTNNGYFVLLPDISYEIGSPGNSALDCVLSAVKKVLRSHSINPEKLGITGHSFGGYETSYIITKTNIFAAASAGAFPSDLVTFYLSYNKLDYIPEIWRFEDFQLRIGSSLFEDYDAYLENSPVRHAANISTPLLSYTGDKDNSVDFNQSKEFYLALRRLGKKNILLIYPDEDHAFMNKEQQTDLTLKNEQWFDHYLRDKSKPIWMEAQ